MIAEQHPSQHVMFNKRCINAKFQLSQYCMNIGCQFWQIVRGCAVQIANRTHTPHPCQSSSWRGRPNLQWVQKEKTLTALHIFIILPEIWVSASPFIFCYHQRTPSNASSIFNRKRTFADSLLAARTSVVKAKGSSETCLFCDQNLACDVKGKVYWM